MGFNKDGHRNRALTLKRGLIPKPCVKIENQTEKQQ